MQWVRQHDHILATGPTRVGKSFLALCAGAEVVPDGSSATYTRAAAAGVPILSADRGLEGQRGFSPPSGRGSARSGGCCR
ncbi:MAG: ATP-binding protein [Acidobacteria bacterium]|nr:ATP-binding protein [Acidobacteriota bacterium]